MKNPEQISTPEEATEGKKERLVDAVTVEKVREDLIKEFEREFEKADKGLRSEHPLDKTFRELADDLKNKRPTHISGFIIGEWTEDVLKKHNIMLGDKEYRFVVDEIEKGSAE